MSARQTKSLFLWHYMTDSYPSNLPELVWASPTFCVTWNLKYTWPSLVILYFMTLMCCLTLTLKQMHGGKGSKLVYAIWGRVVSMRSAYCSAKTDHSLGKQSNWSPNFTDVDGFTQKNSI